MNKKNQRQTMKRRDFLNGCAVSLAAGSALSPLEAMAQGLLDSRALPPDYYPPTRQGLRGSHAGSFEIGHTLRDGGNWQAIDSGEGEYDLIVVGGGISGLAAAYLHHSACHCGATTVTGEQR